MEGGRIRRQGAELRAGRRSLGAGLRFGEAASAEAGGRVREGEGPDAAVQSPRLAAGAWRRKRRSVMKEGAQGAGSHAGEGAGTEEDACGEAGQPARRHKQIG